MTVTNADNFGSRDRLQLNYTLETSHDTQVSVADAGQALDDTDVEFQPVEQTLGSDVSGNAQDLLAGSTVDGVVVFDEATESTTLSEWSITLVDGGVDRLPSFTNIPVGTMTSAYADCELVLPCVWLTPQGDVSITLTAAGGYTTNSRLSTTFVVQSATTINVALDAGAFAIDPEGTEFTGRTYRLGTSVGGGKITAEAVAENDLTGIVEYYRTTATPTVLDEVTLVLYQDSPVPRWNPKFVNVPAQ